MNKPSEEEIQKALKMLKKDNPEKATRENAIKAAEGLKQMAGLFLDKIDEDLKSGKLIVKEDGEVIKKD